MTHRYQLRNMEKQVLKYLKGTHVTWGIQYGADGTQLVGYRKTRADNTELSGYSDSDWAGDERTPLLEKPSC